MNELMQRAIDGLSAPESETRAVSATEIYKIGRALADDAAYPWWGDEDLAALLNGNDPKMTIGLAVTPERFNQIHEASGLPRFSKFRPIKTPSNSNCTFPADSRWTC